jgi:hypothetical protein
MRSRATLIRGAWALALAGALATSAGALTLKRADLENLVAGNGVIVVASVERASPHWNRDGSLILTDFRLKARDVLKGRVADDFSLTLMGGTDGKYTTLIPGGADLIPGRTYLLFLRDEELPGTERVTTVAEHRQGVFDIVDQDGVQWAVSQAVGEALIPDEEDRDGDADVPGGEKGMSLAELTRSITALVQEQSADGGVK